MTFAGSRRFSSPAVWSVIFSPAFSTPPSATYAAFQLVDVYASIVDVELMALMN